MTNLEVEGPRGVAFLSQNREESVKPLWVVREVLRAASVSHFFPIFRHDEDRVRCVRVQSHIHCVCVCV